MTIKYLDSKRISGTSNEYKIHTFLNSTDDFEITAGSGDVEYLVVAGGGSGCNNYGGGGGAGGLKTGTVTLSTSTGSSGVHTVTVGSGGGYVVNTISNGSNSIFDTITSTGGGGGGNQGAAGGNGGSGGGGGSYTIGVKKNNIVMAIPTRYSISLSTILNELKIIPKGVNNIA